MLLDKLRNPPDDRFRVVLLLPRKPSNGADTTRGQLGRLLDADDGNRRLLADHPQHPRRRRAPRRCTCTRSWASSTTSG